MADNFIESAKSVDRLASLGLDRSENKNADLGDLLSYDNSRSSSKKREPNDNAIENELKKPSKISKKDELVHFEQRVNIEPLFEGKVNLTPNIIFEKHRDTQTLQFDENQKLIVGTKGKWWTMKSADNQVHINGSGTMKENGIDLPVRKFDNGTLVVSNPDGTRTLRYQYPETSSGLPKIHFSLDGVIALELEGRIGEGKKAKQANVSLILRPDLVHK